MPGAGTSTQSQNKTQQQQEAGSSASTTSGATAGTQVQTGTTQTGPWDATKGLLSNIIGSLNGLSTTPSPAQSEAVAGLQSSASAMPNYGGAASGAVDNLFNGKYSGMLGDSLATYKAGLSPFLSSSYLDPMSTPGLSDALGTMKNDISNSINGQFAAAGRDLSPANTTALARGLTQGMAPVIAGQYNTNVGTQRGAQDAMLGAGQNNVGMLSNLGATGINLAGQIPGLYTQPAAAKLNAANTGYALPYQNLGMLSGLTLPIAGLGQTGSTTGAGSTSGTTAGTTAGNYSGTGSGTTNMDSSSTMSPLQMLFGNNGIVGGLGGASGIGGMLNGVGSGLGSLFALSDARAKDNIAHIGMLYDGQPVYSYNYKGDAKPQIGLMAQEVEQRAPDAVQEIGGLKHVNYGKATERARAIGGMLSGLDLAA